MHALHRARPTSVALPVYDVPAFHLRPCTVHLIRHREEHVCARLSGGVVYPSSAMPVYPEPAAIPSPPSREALQRDLAEEGVCVT